jgi:hypothetical protein
MADDLNQTCDQHSERFDCPEALVHYSPASGHYGLIVHDGGRSYIEISFCPWCGTDLRPLADVRRFWQTAVELSKEELTGSLRQRSGRLFKALRFPALTRSLVFVHPFPRRIPLIASS